MFYVHHISFSKPMGWKDCKHSLIKAAKAGRTCINPVRYKSMRFLAMVKLRLRHAKDFISHEMAGSTESALRLR